MKSKPAIDQSKIQAILKVGRFSACGISYRCTGISISNGYVSVKGQVKVGKIPVLFCGSLEEVEVGSEVAA